jgi:glycosyltransferase involved in cell wall biosynthesis
MSLKPKNPEHPKRIVFLTNLATPYKTDQIESWARLIPGLEIVVWYLEESVGDNLWAKPSATVRPWREEALKGIRAWLRFYFSIRNSVLLVGGYYLIPYWVARLMAFCSGVPVSLVFDGINPQKVSSTLVGIRGYLKKRFIHSCDSFFANGVVGKQFFEALKEEAPLFNQGLFADVGQKKNLAPDPQNRQRESLGIAPDSIVVVFCGRLISRKCVDDLIHAMSYFDSSSNVRLLVIGDGLERGNLESLSKELKVPVCFAGAYTDRGKLFSLISECQILVLPSSDDPWGMVVNEALQLGLRVIVSDRCGCSLDLLSHPDAAKVFPVHDRKCLHSAIKLFVETQIGFEKVAIAAGAINDPKRSALELQRLLSQGIQK